MTYEKEGDRPDQTEMLGQELTKVEKEAYRLIYQGTGNGIASTTEIYIGLYGSINGITSAQISNAVGPVISRLRAKLGEQEIISRRGQGYFSRRRYIELSSNY